jgi:DNA-binding transcriptional regulator LsrR (DeoR family)
MGTVTHEDIAQALQDALVAAQEKGGATDIVDYSLGLTMGEIASHLDLSTSQVRRLLKRAMESDAVECNGRQFRRTMSNERCKVPVYRVKVTQS